MVCETAEELQVAHPFVTTRGNALVAAFCGTWDSRVFDGFVSLALSDTDSLGQPDMSPGHDRPSSCCEPCGAMLAEHRQVGTRAESALFVPQH